MFDKKSPAYAGFFYPGFKPGSLEFDPSLANGTRSVTDGGPEGDRVEQGSQSLRARTLNFEIFLCLLWVGSCRWAARDLADRSALNTSR
jgi:hypothetical protein